MVEPDADAYDGIVLAVAHRKFREMPEGSIARLGRAAGHVVYDLKQNCFIPPEDVDLSRPRQKMDKVVGHEAPEKWNIDPFRYISPEMAA